MTQQAFDPYLKWLGIRSPRRPPDHYALLGLRRLEDDPDVIANAADRQMAHVKTYQSGQFAQISQRLLNELAAAQVCLLNAEKKRAYDERLRREQMEHAAQWAETTELDADDLRGAALPQASPARPTEQPAIVVADRPITLRRRRPDVAPMVALLTAMIVVGGLGWLYYANKLSPRPSSAITAPPTNPAPAAADSAPAQPLPEVPPSAGATGPTVRRAPAQANPPAANGTEVADQNISPLANALDAVADQGEPVGSKPGQLVGPAQALDEAERALLRKDVRSAGAMLQIAKFASQKEPELASRWRRLDAVYAALQPFVQALEQTVAELKGAAELEQAGKRWRILELRTGRLVLAGPVGQQVLSLADVPSAALLDLVRQGSRAADAQVRRGGVAMLLYDPQGDAARAAQELEQLSLLMPVAEDELLQDLLQTAQQRRAPPHSPANPTAAAQITLARAPWPDPEALHKAQEKVRQTYISPPESDADWRLLHVATLLAAARDESLLAVERAAILQEAFESAVLAGNADALAAAVAAMGAYFHVERWEREHEGLTKTQPHARWPAAQEAIVLRALELGRRAAMDRRMDLALELTSLAAALAKKNKLAEIQSQAKSQAGEIRRWQSQHRELKDAWDADAAGQASSRQALELGHFLCFEQHQWPLGLPKLAEGSDEKLAALAQRDLQAPGNAGDRLRLADQWWQIGEQAPPRTRAAARLRAARWYQQTLPSLTGLERTRVQQRLTQTALDEQAGTSGTSPLTRAAPAQRLVLLPGGASLRLKWIPAGAFLMGPPGRAHEVALSRPFYLATTEVTVAQWNALRPQNPRPADQPGDAPAAGVSWEECQEFVAALNQLPAETPLAARLPTEAQWEYACRAGASSHYNFGDNTQNLAEYAWFGGDSLHRVAQKRPNDWGLFDLHGNVWEWCQDRWGEYPPTAQVDPPGIDWGDRRVLRGGGFRSREEECRCHHRHSDLPKHGRHDYGFRVLIAL